MLTTLITVLTILGIGTCILAIACCKASSPRDLPIITVYTKGESLSATLIRRTEPRLVMCQTRVVEIDSDNNIIDGTEISISPL